MALTKFGGKSKTIFLKEFNSHHLHEAFTVAAGVTVKRGMPLKLTATGEVTTVAADGTEEHLVLGHSIHNGTEGDRVTLGMRGRGIVYATAKTSLVPGAVLYVGQDSVDADFGCYDDTAVTAANMAGWALDIATAEHDEIRVVLK